MEDVFESTNRRSRWLLIFIGLILLCATSFPGHANHKEIHILLSGNSDLYQKIPKAIQGLDTSSKLKLTVEHLENNEPSALSPQLASETDLIIAVGSKATKKVLSLHTSLPVLSTLIPERTFKSLVDSAKTASDKISAIYVDQPIERQAALAKAILPELDVLGVLSDPIDKKKRQELDKKLSKLSLKYQWATIKDPKSASKPIKKLIKRSDAIITLPGKFTQQSLTAKWLLYMSYKKNLPVIGFSQGYLKAGAVAAVYSTPEQIAQQTAEWIKNWHVSGKLPHPQLQSPKYFSVKFNQPVGESLGLTNLSDQEVEEKVKSILGGRP